MLSHSAALLRFTAAGYNVINPWCCLILQLTWLCSPFSHGKILVNTVGVQVVWWVFGEGLGPFLFGVFLVNISECLRLLDHGYCDNATGINCQCTALNKWNLPIVKMCEINCAFLFVLWLSWKRQCPKIKCSNTFLWSFVTLTLKPYRNQAGYLPQPLYRKIQITIKQEWTFFLCRNP